MKTQEKVPQYFSEFNKGFNEFRKEVKQKFEKIDQRFEKMDKRFDKVESTLKEVVRKQDVHFETIGEMKVQITNIENTVTNKANRFYVEGIENRVEKLEKAVFA